jgi:hypothetical protein
MPGLAAPPADVIATHRPTRPSARARWIILAASAFMIVVLGMLWHLCWPFAERAVIDDLQEAGDSQVRIRSFHATYFPAPGCILEGVDFIHDNQFPAPMISIRRLIIRGSYFGLIGRRVSTITAEGLHIVIPPFDTTKPFHIKRSTITIAEIVARDALLDFYSNPHDQHPFRFDIHEAVLRNVGWSAPLTYRIAVHNPKPPGEIAASGKFGVWDQSDAAKTPVSGEYKFEQADLGVFEGISGLLSSTGKFQGNLGHIDISGSANTPDFTVKMSGHPVPLTTDFTAYVDAINGDTYLQRVDAHFRKTHVIAEGSIAGRVGKSGKIALIDLTTTSARIEDILRFFVKQEPPPMSGSAALSTHVELPPGQEPFLRKLSMSGKFELGEGKFSNLHTQTAIDNLSAGARGLKEDAAEPVASEVTGEAIVQNGMSSFRDLDFRIPGAHARVRGTYNIVSRAIDIYGQMWLNTKLSKTTTGVKALASKVIDPFFKKGYHKGEIVPVRLTGTYEKPSYGLAIENAKAESVPRPEPRQP